MTGLREALEAIGRGAVPLGTSPAKYARDALAAHPAAAHQAPKCSACGHTHTVDGCVGEQTPSDRWAGVSPSVCDCDAEPAPVASQERVADQRGAAIAATKAILYNLPVDGFGQDKRLEEYAAIWGNAAAKAVLALTNGSKP